MVLYQFNLKTQGYIVICSEYTKQVLNVNHPLSGLVFYNHEF